MQTLMSGLRAFGIERIWRGFRTNDQTMLAVGAGALLFAWYRKPKSRKLLHTEEISPGETITISAKPRKA